MKKQRKIDICMVQPLTPYWKDHDRVSTKHGPSKEIHHGIASPIAAREDEKNSTERNNDNMLELDDNSSFTRSQGYTKIQKSSKKRSGGKNLLDYDQSVTVASPGLSSSLLRDKQRRERISKGVEAFKEYTLSQGSDHMTVVDDVIDYIKYLKLRLKALCQNRLIGEASSDPYLYLEDYGHFLFHDQMTGEPLEDIVGELMETDMLALIQLLNSKGLFVGPMSLANDLHY